MFTKSWYLLNGGLLNRGLGVLLLPFWQASIFINNLFLSMHSAYKNILDENGQWKEWAIMTRELLIYLPNCSITGGLKLSYLCIPIGKFN